MLLEGMFLPLTTPFTPNGRLNASKLKDNVTRYSKTPAAGLVALSRIGQPTLLSDLETREAMSAVAEAAVAEKVLVAGVARDSVLATLDLIEYAASLGYDAALVPVPSVLRDSRVALEVLSFYRAVADRSALPVVIDSGEGATPVNVIGELAPHSNIIGVVDAGMTPRRIAGIVQATATVKREVTVTAVFAPVTGRMLKIHHPAETIFVSAGTLSEGGTALSVAPPSVQNGLKTRTKKVGFQVLCGRTSGMLEALEAGAVGAMPALAPSAPQVCYEVLAAWKDGDSALAAEKQERLRALALKVEGESSISRLIAAIKYGCDLNGYFGGRPRLPMLPLTAVERGELEDLMEGIRN